MRSVVQGALFLLLLWPVHAHAQLAADFYYREERPEPQVVPPLPADSAAALPVYADSTSSRPTPHEASPALLPSVPDTARASLSSYSPRARYLLGRADARTFYHPPRAVFWGTFGATLGTAPYTSLLGGVATVGAIAAVPPAEHHLVTPTPAYLLDADYHRGYVQQARLRKLGKASAGFGTAVGALAVLSSIVLLALFSSWGC